MGHETLLERILKLRSKEVLVFVNRSIMNHSLIKNFQYLLVEGSRLNYSGVYS
jgi:hypothetical protein